MFEVVLRRVLRMLSGVQVVGLGKVGVMSGLVVVARVVLLRGFGMVMRGHTVMMRRRAMLVRCLL